MRFDLPPALPVIHHEPATGGISLSVAPTTAQRSAPDSSRPDEPDTIILAAGRGDIGHFSTYLTPAMIVHIANELLTDEERAFITMPFVAIAAAPTTGEAANA